MDMLCRNYKKCTNVYVNLVPFPSSQQVLFFEVVVLQCAESGLSFIVGGLAWFKLFRISKIRNSKLAAVFVPGGMCSFFLDPHGCQSLCCHVSCALLIRCTSPN